jgi:membrane protease subunit HflC
MNRAWIYFFDPFAGLLAVASSMLFVVDQRQFGVVYALGQIKEVITEPGLNFKLPPPFQNVSYIDKRLLTLDTTDTEPMLTQEKQRVVDRLVCALAHHRPPGQYIRNVGLDEVGRGQPAQPCGAQRISGRDQQAHGEGACCRTKREALHRRQ